MNGEIGALRRLYTGSLRCRLYLELRWLITPFDGIERLLPRRGSIVDLGCGEGILANHLALVGPERTVLGIERNPLRLARARSTVGARTNIRFAAGDVRSPAGGPWAGAAICDVLHHMEPDDQERTLRAAWANLAPGGVLVVKEPGRDGGLRFRATALADALLYPRDRCRFRSTPEWRTLLEAIGFAVEVRDASRVFGSSVLFVCRRP